MEKDKNNYLVVQSNALIEAQYKLDVLPQKIVRYIVSKIKPDDGTFKKMFYRLEAKDFTALIGREYSGEAIENIMTAADSMLKTRIKIVRGKRFIATNWLASYEYHKGEGWIEFEFSSKLERELLLIKNQFTAYHLSNIAKLKSQYSIRLYELLKQYTTIGHREILLDELKAMLGIEKSEYTLFGHFRAKVLNIAHREILAKTDLDYQWKPFKHVRKVIGIEFYDIKINKAIPDWLIGLLPPKYQKNKDILTNIGKWLELNGEDYCKQKIQYTTSRNPTKYADYLAAALQNDHGADYSPAQASLFPDFEKFGYPIEDGVKIEIEDGETYIFADRVIRTTTGVIPEGQIKKNLKSGKFKIIEDSAT